jgi:hypothetical protein
MSDLDVLVQVAQKMVHAVAAGLRAPKGLSVVVVRLLVVPEVATLREHLVALQAHEVWVFFLDWR